MEFTDAGDVQAYNDTSKAMFGNALRGDYKQAALNAPGVAASLASLALPGFGFGGIIKPVNKADGARRMLGEKPSPDTNLGSNAPSDSIIRTGSIAGNAKELASAIRARYPGSNVEVSDSTTPVGRSSYVRVSGLDQGQRAEFRVSDHGTGPLRTAGYTAHFGESVDLSDAFSRIEKNITAGKNRGSALDDYADTLPDSFVVDYLSLKQKKGLSDFKRDAITRELAQKHGVPSDGLSNLNYTSVVNRLMQRR